MTTWHKGARAGRERHLGDAGIGGELAVVEDKAGVFVRIMLSTAR